MYSVHITPSRVLLPSDSAIFAAYFAAHLCNAVSAGFVLRLAHHLATFEHSALVCLCFIRYAQYISVSLLYSMDSTLVCICFILYTQYIGVYLFYTDFGYCLILLAVYRMNARVQSILIAYFHRILVATVHLLLLSMHIYLFMAMGFCDCYLYHLSQFFVCFHIPKLFGGYFNPATLRVSTYFYKITKMVRTL